MTERRPGQPAGPGELEAIAAAKTEARTAGLTNAEIDGELVADDTDRRGAPQPALGEGTGIAAEFRAFRRGRTLDSLRPKDLTAESRDREPSDGA